MKIGKRGHKWKGSFSKHQFAAAKMLVSGSVNHPDIELDHLKEIPKLKIEHVDL